MIHMCGVKSGCGGSPPPLCEVTDRSAGQLLSALKPTVEMSEHCGVRLGSGTACSLLAKRGQFKQ